MQQATFANIIGPDINEFRGEVNYPLLATKTNYCYVRGSSSGTGRFRVDRKFFEYVRGLRSVGILSGAYHYAVPSTDLTTADAQCDDFIRVLQEAYGPGNYGDLFPVVDIETPQDKSISTDDLLDWVDRFRKRFERKTRRRLMLYTGLFFIQLYNNFRHSTKGFILSNMPLWIAMYKEIPVNPPFPPDAGGWTRWRLWQYTENGTMAGVNPPVDLNYGPTNLDFLKPPSVVRNFRAYTGKSAIILNWSKNPDVDLNGYNIFINSNYVTTVSKNTTSYTIKLAKTPRPNEKYELTIEAFDIDGDFSPTRAKAQVTFRSSDKEYDYVEDAMVKDNLSEHYVINNTTFPKFVPKKDYKDPVDKMQRELVNKQVSNQEYYGREEEFDFYNLNTEDLDSKDFEDFNYNDDLESDMNEVNPKVKYRNVENSFNDYKVRPVFKYYLDEEDDEFDELDNYDDSDEFNAAPVFSNNSYDFEEEDYNLNNDDNQVYYRDEDYIEDELTTNEYETFNTLAFNDYDSMMNSDYDEYIKNDFNNGIDEIEEMWEQEIYRNEDKIVIENEKPLEQLSSQNLNYDTEEEDSSEDNQSIVFNNDFEDSIRYRRLAENQLDVRHKKCKKCKKYKKSKKYCYDCKYNSNEYGIAHAHHMNDDYHDDNYLYHPNYKPNHQYKSKKKKKHHREY